MEDLDLKGISGPVRAWRVVGESEIESRFDAAAVRGLTPLVGRDEEISLLQKRWEQAKDGEGQVVLLSGEAGIGKSRILRGFRERTEGEAQNRILYFCSPYHRNTALRPCVDQIERALRFDKDDDADKRLDKIDESLRALGLDLREYAPVLAALLSIPAQGRYPPLALPPGEAMTKTVIESGLLEDAGDRYTLTGPLPPLAVPTSLQDSLMARLDRLSPIKEVAQLAATIGRNFNLELLAAVSPLGRDKLEDALLELVEAELIYRRALGSEVTYEFKHALVQDAAYASLLRAKRQQYHQRIADALQSEFSRSAELEPALLAYHYTEAGLPSKAIGYWLKAGELLQEQGSVAMSMTAYRNALDIAAADADRCQALIGLGDAHYSHGRMRTALDYFRRCVALSNEHEYFQISVGNQYMVAWTRLYSNEVHAALADAVAAVDAAVDINYLRAEMVARLSASRVLVELGELEEAARHIDRGLHIADVLGANRFKPFLMIFLARVQLARNGQRTETVQISYRR